MPKTFNPKRAKALMILKGLICRLFSISADLFHAALLEDGFSEGDACLLVGPCIRTASSKAWIKKTDICLPSQRNHSNLQRVWVSLLHRPYAQSGSEAMKQIREAYAHWEGRGIAPPDDLAEWWLKR